MRVHPSCKAGDFARINKRLTGAALLTVLRAARAELVESPDAHRSVYQFEDGTTLVVDTTDMRIVLCTDEKGNDVTF